ncbi:SDR family oxidoreductase [Anaerosalibacter bizertensis]|uniref:dTDP-4-dehydrorhamnose reductase n=1 Tax=Anaerosalibacter bizertensis TaxID=932217 RepID=A0A9Q4FM70_9FIRM|nr:SDR family oxidoreductase [Anaerosalibacter bizertensis]MBV1819018.1 SDR family oxidoreductase [Bacteroidales bacterium MSK.15.36]MCB5559708.1 SDR family oxidoreductase [Anaerosalibacter bizertensis]MCG4565613.1 SDR family oxidoreductase [Anaerosalibacter bizertensis]MCG4582621.1 SDR family oxidoreductase [Anaerosalibacter bizertensis]MCG4585199.1 SDR family oxidoreductase [Anaerosalibacter bizertensis]
MKILVLGATGMAGHTISIYLKERGHDITAYSRREFKYCNNINGDITNFSFLKSVIKEGGYDGVINAIGILNKDAEENKSLAVLLNSYLPHYLSDITKNMETKIIHMSTDCVFSGKKGRYSETSFRDGETFYDRSKALGELENHKDLTFRNSIIGPDMNKDGIGLFNWFMKQEGEINGFTKAIWTGVTTLTLAKAMEKALEENLTGLYNLVNNESISKYELLKLFNKHMRDESIKISPIAGVKLDKSLINNRDDFSFIVPSYEQMVIEMKEWIESHTELYPHYFV